MPTQKEPFVPQEDRPEVKIPSPEQPITELKVRDLQAILGGAAIKKFEKIEHKDLKIEKIEHKELKFEKHEKHEIKEFKYEKLEHKEILLEPPLKYVIEPGPDPTHLGDPIIGATLNQLIQVTGNLATRVDELANQVAELRSKK